MEGKSYQISYTYINGPGAQRFLVIKSIYFFDSLFDINKRDEPNESLHFFVLSRQAISSLLT